MPVATQDGAKHYAERIHSRLSDNYTNVFVAEIDNQIVGYILAVIVNLLPEMFEQEYSGFIADVFVLPEYRKRNIGRALVQEAVSWFRGQGIEHYEWYVASQNITAVAFWRAVGGRNVMIRMRADTGDNNCD